ncbi:hypothetical protein ATO50_09260 [Aeromonas hydrophila]|nr:hypothetical protein OI72_21050 [Aeromonas hydrophila]KWR69334.1 hypothetical protein ATO50_09260 [Aeromonas hydrophila]OFC47160.1 hypothetical protein BA189_08305 [Aeromonas hydrophila]OFC52878.1 hypothetical protein BA188_10510 [Aeromonas hydrophila]
MGLHDFEMCHTTSFEFYSKRFAVAEFGFITSPLQFSDNDIGNFLISVIFQKLQLKIMEVHVGKFMS